MYLEIEYVPTSDKCKMVKKERKMKNSVSAESSSQQRLLPPCHSSHLKRRSFKYLYYFNIDIKINSKRKTFNNWDLIQIDDLKQLSFWYKRSHHLHAQLGTKGPRKFPGSNSFLYSHNNYLGNQS